MPFQLFLCNKFNYIYISTSTLNHIQHREVCPGNFPIVFTVTFFQPAHAATQAVSLFTIISLHVVVGCGKWVVRPRYMMFHRIYLTFHSFIVSATLHFIYLDVCHSKMFGRTSTQKCYTALKKTFIEAAASSITFTNQ